MSEKLLLIGGGGHANSLLELFRKNLMSTEFAYVDSRTSKGQALSSLKRFVCLEDAVSAGFMQFSNAIGLSLPLARRFESSEEAESFGLVAMSLIANNSAVISRVNQYSGAQILTNAVIQNSVTLGRHVVVGTSAVIEHDAFIGDGSFVAPTATILGGAVVGKFCLIGAGSIVLPQIRVGEGSVIGAGAVVTRDVSSGDVVTGNPAKSMRVESLE